MEVTTLACDMAQLSDEGGDPVVTDAHIAVRSGQAMLVQAARSTPSSG